MGFSSFGAQHSLLSQTFSDADSGLSARITGLGELRGRNFIHRPRKSHEATHKWSVHLGINRSLKAKAMGKEHLDGGNIVRSYTGSTDSS